MHGLYPALYSEAKWCLSAEGGLLSVHRYMRMQAPPTRTDIELYHLQKGIFLDERREK